MQRLNNWSKDVLASLWSDGGLSVFRYYGFEPQRKAQKENPFRNEKTSSFYVVEKFGKIIFKDFGDDAYKGDAIKFVMLFENTDYKNALQIIAKIYNLIDFDFQPKKLFQKTTQLKENTNFERKLVNIYFRDFSKEELNFWFEKGQITKEILEKNNVKAVQSFEIEIEKDKTKIFQNLQFHFAYTILEQKSYKIYVPKPEFRVYAHSKTIFLPNLNPAKNHFGENFAYSFGIDTLSKNQPLILCGGEPDCLALKSMGYNAFTLGDERATIPDFIQEKIKNIAPTQISVLYDTDYTGLKSSFLLEQRLGFQRMILPKLFKQKNQNLPKPEKNDLCDYLSLYGKDEELELCLEQKTFRNKDYILPKTPFLKVKKYLSEKINVLASFIQKHKKIQIDADAGIGKTFTMLAELPQKIDLPIIFAVPFALQVEQIAQEYGNHIKDLACFTNQAVKNDTLEIENLQISKINVCTFDRLKIIFKRTKNIHQKIMLVIDESHLLTSEYAYRSQAIHEVLEICKEAEKIVYLSATPDYALCYFSGFRLLKIEREQNPTLQITPIDYQGEPKKALWELLKNEREKELKQNLEENKLTIVRLNNKVLAHVMSRLLIESNLYKEEEIDFIYSEKRQCSRTTARNALIHHSEIPQNIRLLFVTACFDCGINLLNENIKQVISFETRYTDNCLDTLKQLVARFRKVNQLDVKVCKPFHYLEKLGIDNKKDLYKKLENDAKSKIALMPYADLKFRQKIDQNIQYFQKQKYDFKTPNYLKFNGDISATAKILQKTEDNQYIVNYNYIRFCLKDFERKNLDSKNFYINFANEMPLAFIKERILLTPNKNHQNKNVRILWQQIKQEKDLRTSQICENIKEHSQIFFEAVHAEFKDIKLKKSIQEHFAIQTTPATATPLITFFENENTQNGTKTVKTSSILDEEVLKLSNRFFHLKEMLVPTIKIPELLKNYANDVSYGELTKTLTNHLYLLAIEKAQNDLPLLITDHRKLNDALWLKDFKTAVLKWKPKNYVQKTTKDNLKRLKSLEYDLKLQRKQTGDLFFDAVFMLNEIQKNGKKLKANYREIKRRFKASRNKLNKLTQKYNQLKTKTENSQIKAFTIDEISLKINQLKTHKSDWQGEKANIRLLNSMFETKTQKRLVYLENGKTIEKTFVIILRPLTFEETLKRFGFSETEAVTYKEYVICQIETDIQNRKMFMATQENDTISAKNVSFSLQTDNIYFNKAVISENALGYPVFWD